MCTNKITKAMQETDRKLEINYDDIYLSCDIYL